jgi:hypothetical protein
MNFYFFPQVDGLDTAITLTNFPPTGNLKLWCMEQFIYAAWSDGSRWQVANIEKIEIGQTVTISQSELPALCSTPETAFLFMDPERLEKSYEQLPISNHMASVPAWRSNIRLSSSSTSVSYQGEYPGGMTGIPSGTLLSFSTMIQNKDKLSTFFVLPNLRQDPTLETCEVLFAKPDSTTPLKRATAWRNRCNTIDISDIKAEPNEIIVAYSIELTGIPLYLSTNQDQTQMSFEHTHPPGELALFGDRPELQKKLKKTWFERLPK